MSDIKVDHYPELAEEDLWDRLGDLQRQREANLAFVVPTRRIRMELIQIVDALDACIHPDHR